MSKALGKQIRRARQKSNWSQRYLADKIDVAQSLISNWEQGKATPSEKQIRQLERRLGPLENNSNKASTSRESTLDGPAPFGAWLSKTRQGKEYSVAELSEMSNVSMPTIYAVESGKIENPRTETVRKLKNALGEDTPEGMEDDMNEEAKIEGLGFLMEFDPHDKESCPSAPGVYVLYDISDRPIYVGMGSNIGKRISQHQDKFWFKQPIVETASYVEIEDDMLRRQVETLLIKFLKSNAVINKQNVDR